MTSPHFLDEEPGMKRFYFSQTTSQSREELELEPRCDSRKKSHEAAGAAQKPSQDVASKTRQTHTQPARFPLSLRLSTVEPGFQTLSPSTGAPGEGK